MENEYTAQLHFSSVSSYFDKNKLIPIPTNKFANVHVIFVFGSDFPRRFSSYDMLRLWKGASFWILSITLFFGAIVLYYLRRLAELRVVNFMIGFLEVFAVVFGGGNIRCRHYWEKMFFAIALFGSFFLVSIILANFSMHSVLFHEPIQVNTFEKLAKRNVPFYLSKELAAYKSEIDGMLR